MSNAHLIFFFFFFEKKNAHLAFVWIQIINENYFAIQLIFFTIYGSHYTISTNFYLYLQYFQQKVFSFSKISGFQTDPK